MSGGYYNYENDALANAIFHDKVQANYALDKHATDSRIAATLNPLEDHEISELAYDVFCLLHSYDWYIEGDNSREQYEKDIAFFKKKWLTGNMSKRLEHLLEVASLELDEVKNKYAGELASLAIDTAKHNLETGK